MSRRMSISARSGPTRLASFHEGVCCCFMTLKARVIMATMQHRQHVEEKEARGTTEFKAAKSADTNGLTSHKLPALDHDRLLRSNKIRKSCVRASEARDYSEALVCSSPLEVTTSSVFVNFRAERERARRHFTWTGLHACKQILVHDSQKS